MIDYKNKDKLKAQITDNINELIKIKTSYNEKVKLYNNYIETIDSFEEENTIKKELSIQELNKRIDIFNTQIDMINNNLNILKDFLNDHEIESKKDTEKKVIINFNEQYEDIKNNYINNCFLEDDITNKYINCLVSDFETYLKKIKEVDKDKNKKTTSINVENHISINNEIKNNDTLLISEKEGKVILPYTKKEVLEIYNNNNNTYKSIEEVIEKEFTRDLLDYKVQFMSRYIETMKITREKEKYGLIDSIAIATEMMKKRFLHPAIISACRNLNELDVYLDCLDKNELDDFKIFKIKYELYPMLVKTKSKGGERYIETQESGILTRIKKIFKVERINES